MFFDCIVIGKGLIGSATAKYMAAEGRRVAVIGPDEPEDHERGIVFSSHYDQARIQRIIGTHAAWTMLNKRSVEAYPDIQKKSGITFYTPSGCLYVNPHGWDEYLTNAGNFNKLVNSITKQYRKAKDLMRDFPGYQFSENSVGLFEGDPAGIINPRLLIKAQLEIFKNLDGTIIKEIVSEVRKTKNGFTIETLGGNLYNASKSIVTAGAFINNFKLLPVKLQLNIKSETTIWVKVSSRQTELLKHLPALLYEINEPEIQNIYLIPPVLYPDNNNYLKMGANMPEDVHFSTLEEMQEWFRVPCTGRGLQKLENAVHFLLPDLKMKSTITKKCIIARTSHKRPYIGNVDDNWYVAAGGNGYGAMCSDAIGKLAAHAVVHSAFSPEFSSEDFQPVKMH